MVRRVLLSQASRRNARDRRNLLRLARQRRFRRGLCLYQSRRRGIPLLLSATGAPEFGKALERRRARATADPPRPLCRIQFALRSRHHFWAADRRQCRIDPLVDAAGGEVAVTIPAPPNAARR